MTQVSDFHAEMDRFQNHVPGWMSRWLNRLRAERAIWVRAPTGVALIGGGVLGFLPLPVVSIWMLPVGLALLAHDVPMMRGPMARVLRFTNRKIEKRKNGGERRLAITAHGSHGRLSLTQKRSNQRRNVG